MTKFKCTENSRDFVEVLRDKEGRPALTVGDNHSASVAFLEPTDAPALSLAILEAAGYEERQKGWDVLNSADENFAQAMRCLSKGVEAQERITAEAEAQAELEAEALELCNAAVIECGNPPYPSVERMGEKVLRRWLAVARRAREINKEGK